MNVEEVPAEDRARAAAALKKIFAKRILMPFDNLLARLSADHGAPFHVPAARSDSTETAMSSLVSGLAAFVFTYVDNLFPKGSWPWTTAREAVFVLGGSGKYTGMELQRIHDSENTGPLGYLTIAKLLTQIKHPGATELAERGLLRLSVADFHKDLRVLLEEESALVKRSALEPVRTNCNSSPLT